MSEENEKLKIKIIEIKDLNFPSEDLNFLICQFSLFLNRRPFIAHRKIGSIWNRLENALIFSRDIKSNFFLAPEYTLPFSETKKFIEFIKNDAPKNSVYCIPVEHLTLKQLRNLACLLNIKTDTLNSYFPSNYYIIDTYASLIFNVAIIGIKDNKGKLVFQLQPKIFPANFEEGKNIGSYLFQGGQVINIFQSTRLSFAVMICFDFIARDGLLPNTIKQWINQSKNHLDFLFILQVNPKPIHREYERELYFFNHHPDCKHTSLFFVNCASTSHLVGEHGKIEGFNKTAVLGKFKIEQSNEYKVESCIEIPKDKHLGQEILLLEPKQRMMLIKQGERIAWIKTNPLKNVISGPSHPRENFIHIYAYKKGYIKKIELTTGYKHSILKGQLQDAPLHAYRPITIIQPPFFRGRSDDVLRIKAFLKGIERCLLIYGEPGIGKSVLAQYATFTLLMENPDEFTAGLWFSSKDRHLSLKNFISDFSIGLDCGYLQQLEIAEQKNEIIRILDTTLKKSSVIIVDNIETIKDLNMLAFIEELQHHAKVILTSRNHTPIKVCSSLTLGSLNDSDVRLLVEYHWPDIDESLLHRLSTFLRGSPFAIHLFFGYLKAKKSATLEQTIEDLETGKKNVIDWIFQNTWDSLDQQVQMVIISFQLFADTFTEEAIKGISRLPLLRLDELFEELKKRHFIESVEFHDPLSLRYQIHPLVRKFSEEKKPKISLRNRYIEYYRQFVKEQCGKENFKHVDQEIHNIERALDFCVKEKKFETYLNIVSQLYYYYYERGFWNDAIYNCIKGYKFAKKIENANFSIEMSSKVCWCAYRNENYKLAKKWLCVSKDELTKSRRLFAEFHGMIEETEARISLVDRKINYDKAQELIERAIGRYKKSSDPKVVTLKARALTYLGELHLEQGDPSRAIEIFTEVKNLAEKYKNEKFADKILAWTIGNIGEALLMKSKDYPDRVKYLEICITLFNEGLNRARKIERQHTIAHCCWGLGTALIYLGRIDEGRKYLFSAKDIYQNLGKKSRLSQIESIIDKINQSNDNKLP